MDKKRVFSGIKPSGDLHLGNYIGALSQWVTHQDEYENFFCIVDMHAITVPIDPNELHRQTRSIAAWYLAAGIDPQKSTIFVQSHNFDHPYLAWILNCFTGMGQLNRMTQYKDKKDKNSFVGVGLFDYPVLMAADILLYDAYLVPVGEDQKQHVELTRDIAERFNSQFGEVFVLPEYMPPLTGKRIMSLQHPDSKMSKSESDANGTIDLNDSPDEVNRKVMSAVTDTGNEIKFDPKNKPAITNLVEIFISLSEKTIEDLDQEYSGKGYKQFKQDLAEVIINTLTPIQNRYQEIVSSDTLDEALLQGAERAHQISQKKLNMIRQNVGFVL